MDEREDRRETRDEIERTDDSLRTVTDLDSDEHEHDRVERDDEHSEDSIATDDEHDGLTERDGGDGDDGDHDSGERGGRRGGAAWWAIAGIIGALVLVFLFYPRPAPYLSPAPTPTPPAAPTPVTPTVTNIKVVGFVDDTAGQGQMTTNVLDLLKANRSKIDFLSPRWFDVKADGTVSMKTDAATQTQVASAGIPLTPRYNFTGEAALTDPKLRTKAVQMITDTVTKSNFAGCILDMPKLSDKAKAALPALLTDLRAKLPGKMLSVTLQPVAAVGPTTTPSAPLPGTVGPGGTMPGSLSPGGMAPSGIAPNPTTPGAATGGMNYDFKAIAAQVDQIVLMMVDGHTTTTAPGPVAPIGWVEDNIKAAIASGAPPKKLILGLATWGFDWIKGKTGQASTMPMNRIPAAKSDSHQFDTKNQASFLTYTDSAGNKHEMWWEDEKTLAPKVDLAKKYNLGGVAVLKLGFADQTYWTALGKSIGR